MPAAQVLIAYRVGDSERLLVLGCESAAAMRQWTHGLHTARSLVPPSPLGELSIWFCDAFEAADTSSVGRRVLTR